MLDATRTVLNRELSVTRDDANMALIDCHLFFSFGAPMSIHGEHTSEHVTLLPN